jgi:hypothetical protein
MIMMMMMMNEIFYRNESLKKHLTEIFVWETMNKTIYT